MRRVSVRPSAFVWSGRHMLSCLFLLSSLDLTCLACISAVEKYNPCVTSVSAPVQFQGLDDMHPQWQKEPSSHLELDFVYGYQGASCWDQDLFGCGPGQDNLFFLQVYLLSFLLFFGLPLCGALLAGTSAVPILLVCSLSL